MVASDALVTCRFAEFQKLARQKGTLKSDGELDISGNPAQFAGAKRLGKGSSAEGATAGKGAFMQEFFEQVTEINGILAKGRSNVNTMGEVLEDALMATTPERQEAVSERLNTLVMDTNKRVHVVKEGLEELKRRTEALPDEAGGTKAREIRNNMQNQLAKKHCQVLVDFQKAQLDFKEALNQRQVKEIKMVLPDADEEDVQRVIDNGESLSLVVAQKMAGTHHMLIDEVNRIAEKHQDITRLERSVADLAQMFQEMAVLVDAQGEMLDSIEMHTKKTKACISKAEDNLITTRKAQHKAQKWMCCLAVIMLIVLLSILAPILTQA